VTVGEDDGDGLGFARVRFGLLDEGRPDRLPFILALRQTHPVEGGVETDQEEEIPEAFGGGLERALGICGDALQRPLHRARADLIVSDVPWFGHETRPAHRQRAGKREAILGSDVLEVPVIMGAVQLKQQLKILFGAEGLRRSSKAAEKSLRKGTLKGGFRLGDTSRRLVRSQTKF